MQRGELQKQRIGAITVLLTYHASSTNHSECLPTLGPLGIHINVYTEAFFPSFGNGLLIPLSILFGLDMLVGVWGAP